MKTRPNSYPPARQLGAAALVVLILLFLMMAFIVGNSVTLHKLKRELRLVETRQTQRHSATHSKARPAAATNVTEVGASPATTSASEPARHP